MASCTGRTVQLEDDEIPYRKGSSATIRSEGTGTQYYAKRGIIPVYDSSETLRQSRPNSTTSASSMRVRRISSLSDGNIRFPKLEDCAHFHYDVVEIEHLKVSLSEDEHEIFQHNGEDFGDHLFYVKVVSGEKTWTVRKNINQFRALDQKLHRCIFDRKFSHLPHLGVLDLEEISMEEMRGILGDYLCRFSTLSGSMLNCGSVLNWLEIDNRGNRILAVDDSGINTPAIAAAHAIKRYMAQAADEISLEVGDIVSVIDMPTTEDTVWWRGKRGFEVGFFPSECVEVIGEKLPASVVSSIPETPSNKALMRKHGKLLSFLRMFFSTRPAREQLKQSGIVKERVFGCDLGEHLLNSGHDVPLVLKSCADIIESEGIVDGIYRLSGISSNIQKLRLAFDEDRVPDLTDDVYLQDIHSISSLLKMYFRELPNPLLTYQLYDKFADAVRDEENKLLKIHDVVQQLPPPHYRTTQYLMRHLARVAAHGHETGMHSKNLAIVWAPNLLRSKELESGGGAAALQGVGIQAVVTEFLILYADLIFSDKMPAYSSPELKKSLKKPRPKSLAISTPTRLLSLEEARERALNSGFTNTKQKYIDVGGGPSNLPSKFHTVIDLPGYRKKGSKETAGKQKKSPAGGLKSLFSRSRSGSIKQKGRKPSIHESLNFEPGERKAITEEDVQHWKRRRIRSAKSAESLLSLPLTSRLGSPLGESLDPSRILGIFSTDEMSSSPRHKRSLSTDTGHPLMNCQEHSVSYPSFVVEDSGTREVPIDVNPDDIEIDFTVDGDTEKSEGKDNRAQRKQSFVRGDSKRRVICHRRMPSAPTTPRPDKKEPEITDSSCRDVDEALKAQQADPQKSASQPVLDTPLSRKPPKVDRSRYGYGSKESRQRSEEDRAQREILVPSSPREGSKQGTEEGVSEKRKGSKTPPKDRKKMKEGKDRSPLVQHRHGNDAHIRRAESEPKVVRSASSPTQPSPTRASPQAGKKELISELPESPGVKRKLWTSLVSSLDEPVSGTKVWLSTRYHDYAEIDDPDSSATSAAGSSVTGASPSDVHSQCSSEDGSPESPQRRRYRVESIENMNSLVGGVESQPTTRKSQSDFLFRHSRDDLGVRESGVSASETVLETDFPAEQPQGSQHRQIVNTSVLRGEENRMSESVGNTEAIRAVDNRHGYPTECLPDITNLEEGLRSLNQPKQRHSKSMTKCMSIPSDIERSLENIAVGGSHSDLMSSVTISELSQSQENLFPNEPSTALDRRRRSTSLDGLSDESPLSRTLREINDQIDKAFKREKERAQSLKNLPLAEGEETDLNTTLASELISYDDELAQTPTGQRSFGSVRECDLRSPSSIIMPISATSRLSNGFDYGQPANEDTESCSREQEKFVDRPAAEIHIVETPRVIRAPLRPSGQKSVEEIQTVTSDLQSTRTPTPTRPSPPDSLAIASPVVSTGLGSSPAVRYTGKTMNQSQATGALHINVNSEPASAETKQPTSHMSAGKFRLSEEDFQKALLSEDPDSLRQFEQSMMYSPVRSRGQKGPLHDARSNRSSVLSPEERSRSNRSSIASPESSPSSNLRHQKLRKTQSAQSPSPTVVTGSPSFSDARKQEVKSVTSPLSPEHKQPRWEDLAGLNESFHDLAVFNDNWRKQLAPTGDSIRQSHSVAQSTEKLSGNQEQYVEVGVGRDTVVEERPSIVRKTPVERSVNFPGGSPTMPSARTSSGVIETDIGSSSDRMTSERSSIRRANTVPSSPTMHQANVYSSPKLGAKPVAVGETGRTGGQGLELKHATSVDSANLVGREGQSDSAVTSARMSADKNAVRKSHATPRLTRQTSFDSSYSSVRVTSLGSSLEEMETCISGSETSIVGDSCRTVRSEASSHITQSVRPDSSNPASGSVVMRTSEKKQSEFSTTNNIASPSSSVIGNQASFLASSSKSQSSMLVSNDNQNNSNLPASSQSSFGFSASGQSSASFPEVTQPSPRSQRSEVSSSGPEHLLPQMLQEIDVNESCLGIASHQNLSNEFKEMFQESMKEQAAAVPSSSTFQSVLDPLSGCQMESSLEIPSDVQSIDLPEEEVQFLFDGPIITATENVLTSLGEPRVPVPIDNSEEEFQNAINADRERNLARMESSVPQHVSVCGVAPQPLVDSYTTLDMNARGQGRGVISDSGRDCLGRFDIGDSQPDLSDVATLQVRPHAAGLEHLTLISPTSMESKAPETCYQESMSSSSSSSLTDSTTSFSHALRIWNLKQQEMLRDTSVPDLPPPMLETIEVFKSVIVKPKIHGSPELTRGGVAKTKEKLDDEALFDAGKAIKSRQKLPTPAALASSERGEAKLVIERRPRLQKKVQTVCAEKIAKPMRQVAELLDSDQGEMSGTEDEVFVETVDSSFDPNFSSPHLRNISWETNPLFDRSRSLMERYGRDQQRNYQDPVSRCSLDESMMQVASIRHDNLVTIATQAAHAGGHSQQEELEAIGIGHDSAEDIRFSKAHRSTKLMSLCEMFEKGSTQSLNSDPEEAKEDLSSLQDRNVVSSIKQMHESYDPSTKQMHESYDPSTKQMNESYDTEDRDRGDSDVFSKPRLVRMVQLGDEAAFTAKGDNCATSPPYIGKKSTFPFETAGLPEMTSDRSSVGSGKPPKYRSSSKTRTASESSLSESESVAKGSPKTSRMEGSPKSARTDSSPKSARIDASSKIPKMDGSLVGSRLDGPPKSVRLDGSPKSVRLDGSPKSARVDGSPKSVRSDGSPKSVRLDGSPKGSRADGSTKTGGNEGYTGSSTDGSPKAARSLSFQVEGSAKSSRLDGSVRMSQVESCPKGTRLDGQPKGPKVDGSPKSLRYDSSPKVHRYSLASSEEDGSPKFVRQGQMGSPKGLKYNRPLVTDEGTSQIPRPCDPIMPGLGAGIPAPRSRGSVSEETSPQSVRHASCDHSVRSSLGSVGSDTSPELVQRRGSRGASDKKTNLPTQRTRRGETVEARYHLSFERESTGTVQVDVETTNTTKNSAKREKGSTEVKRRGSIKELMNMFETKGDNPEAPASPPQQVLARTRVRSVSPGGAGRSPGQRETVIVSNVRHSIEIPVRSIPVLSNSDGLVKPQQLRLGPKPFYGAKQ